MLDIAAKFGEGLGGGVAQKWIDRVLGVASVFWIGGLAAYAIRFGQENVRTFVTQRSSLEVAVLLIAAGFLIAASSTLVEWLQFPTLRFLEGYWPWIFGPIRSFMTGRVANHVKKKRNSWTALAKRFGSLNTREMNRYISLDRELALYPEDQTYLLPTRLGNRMRAAETYALERYGLESSLMWPRLWLILSSDDRAELGQAQQSLNASVRFVLWSLAFALWAIWTPWALLAAVAGLIVGYRRSVGAASIFGELLAASFDVNHQALYDAMGWPKPIGGVRPGPKAEGLALSVWTRRGTLRDWRMPARTRRWKRGLIIGALVLLAARLVRFRRR
jgi:hypothetical protein